MNSWTSSISARDFMLFFSSYNFSKIYNGILEVSG
jgi:hypothetical protein